MNELVIKSAADVERFVNQTLEEDYQFRLLHKDKDCIFVDVLIASKIIERLLYKKIASSRWANLVVLPLTVLYGQLPYPKQRRIYFCPVNNATYPSSGDLPRNDCAAVLTNVPLIHTHADIQVLLWLLTHNWKHRMQVPEPFFWYQDVIFSDQFTVDKFIEAAVDLESLIFNIKIAPRENNLSVRLFFNPWRFTFGHVPHRGPKKIN